MKKKIEKSIINTTFISLLVLTAAVIAFLASEENSEITLLGSIVIVLFAVLLFVISVFVSRRIAEEITKPLSDLDITDDTSDAYEEIAPLLQQIKNQDKEKELALQIRREFSSNVSHELKTPLTSILGYSQMISGGLAKEEDIQSFAGKIEHETTSLINLINDIIKLSHLEEEGFVLEKENINLYELAKEVCAAFAERPNGANIKIDVRGEDTVVYGNRTQLTELISNLVENAYKYNRENGRITVTAENSSLTVEDTGIGIPKEYQDRVFERFFRVDKSRSKKVNGTGLGLSIVKHIALSHGAKISLESREGEGTRITVNFKKVFSTHQPPDPQS